MANFLTTERKKWAVTVGLLISGWHVLTMGGNPFNLPALPAIFSNQIFGTVSLLFVAGLITLYTIFMIWTEY